MRLTCGGVGGTHGSLAPPHCEAHIVGAKQGAIVGGLKARRWGKGFDCTLSTVGRRPDGVSEESDVHVKDDAGCNMQSRQQRARGGEQRPSWGVNQQAHGHP